MDKLLSVVIPAYNEEALIGAAAETILRVLGDAHIPCELVFVDDGSKDGTWANISAAGARDKRVRGVRFSRNFGKEAALLAGLKYASGDCCVTIDCDLQHPPEKIVEMYRLWEQGWQVVEGVKSDRGDEGALHRFAANTFYRIMTNAVGFEMKDRSDFKLLDRKAVDALLSMPEKDTFYRALSAWVGFRSATVPFEVAPRTVGESKWSTRKLVKYAIRNITSFTSSPMHIVTTLGVIMLLFALVLGVQTIVNKARGGAAEGFTTVIIVVLLTGSLIMVSLGIMGLYLTKMFDELKARPRYIVAETVGDTDEKADR